jgi:hypothetical protein
MTRFLVYVAALLGLLSQGCITISRGTHEDLALDSTPAGALATLSDGQSCTTPCTLKISRGNGFGVKFSKPGCIEQTALVQANTSGGEIAKAFAGNLISDEIGMIVDASDGALYDAEPNPLSSTLQCIPSPAMSDLTPAAAAVSAPSVPAAVLPPEPAPPATTSTPAIEDKAP